jgi:predicted extracellular nuclease
MGAAVDGPWTSTSQCDLHPGKLFDRAPYVIDIKKGDLSVTMLSNHFASQGHQTRCRDDEADYVRRTAATLQSQGRNVLVAEDLNDFEFSHPLSVLTSGNVLTNLWSKAPQSLAHSYKFNGHLQTLDHILVTAGLESRVTDMRYIHLDGR